VLTVAKELGIPVEEHMIPREMLYIADEVFFTGTAAEVTSIRSVDKITVGDGAVGPVTKAIRAELFGIFDGSRPDKYNWLTPVPVRQKIGA
jgi:branched-chain amino acid aminotransferase